jgi:hypothetical protein
MLNWQWCRQTDSIAIARTFLERFLEAGELNLKAERPMAIIPEFNVLIVRKAEIEQRYIGGLSQFRHEWLLSRKQWCEDDHLIAFSSMANGCADIAASLRASGIDVLETNETVRPQEMVSRCSWLKGGIHETIEHPLPNGTTLSHEVFKYWLRGHEPGDTVRCWRIRTSTPPAITTRTA